MSRRRPIATAAVVATLAVTACGGGGGEAGAEEADARVVSTGLSFDPDSVVVPAGEVTLAYDNRDEGIPHNLHVLEIDAKTEVVVGPELRTVTFTAEPGEYELICDIHPGMQGTLTVTG